MEENHCEQPENQELVRVKVEHETELNLLPPPSEAHFIKESTSFYHWQGSYLGDHTYAIMCPLSEVNFKEEADVRYSPTGCIKEEPDCAKKLKQLSCSDIEVCKVNEMLASTGTDMLKDEPALSSDSAECEMSELTSQYPKMLKDELVLIPEHIKEECGISEAAMAADLYTDHAVKNELVLGPEHPHRPDVNLAVRSWVVADADSWSAMRAPVRVHSKQLKDCSVMLERLPGHVAMLAEYQSKDTTTRADTTSDTEKKYTSRQSICCGEAFTLKADLKKHVSCVPTSMEKEGRILSNYETLRSSIRDCWVKLERCDSTNHKPAETIVPSSEKETILQIEIHAETNNYICDICSKTFQEEHSLVCHIKMHLERSHMLQKNENILINRLNIHEYKRKKPYTCELCKKVFKLHRELIRHEMKHSGQRPYSCLICFKKFTRINSVKVHIDTVHNTGEKTFSCEICQKKFKCLRYLETHKLVHTNRQPYYCKICNKTFKRLGYFKRHTNIHISGPEERKHQCQICSKKFMTVRSLNRHQRVHDGLRPYSCEICSKTFALLNTLKTHIRTHTGQKTYECNICKKQFAQIGGLKSHTLLHEGVKHFKCEICSKSFMRLSTLKSHKLTHGEKKHICEICDKRFFLRNALKQHIKNSHTKM